MIKNFKKLSLFLFVGVIFNAGEELANHVVEAENPTQPQQTAEPKQPDLKNCFLDIKAAFEVARKNAGLNESLEVPGNARSAWKWYFIIFAVAVPLLIAVLNGAGFYACAKQVFEYNTRGRGRFFTLVQPHSDRG